MTTFFLRIKKNNRWKKILSPLAISCSMRLLTTRFHRQLAHLNFGSLISFWARCSLFFKLGIRASLDWTRSSLFFLLDIWARSECARCAFFSWYLVPDYVMCQLTVKFVKYNRSVFTLYPNGSTTVVLWLYLLYPHPPPPPYYTVIGQPLTFFVQNLFSQKETNAKSKENVRFCLKRVSSRKNRTKTCSFFLCL